LRISFIMLGFRDHSTGGYSFNFRMIRALEEAGHRVDVVHYTTLPARLRGSRLRGSFHVLTSVLKKHPDLVIVSKSYSFMAPLRVLLPFIRIPVLYLVHHLEWHDRAEAGSRGRRAIVRWFLNSGWKIWVNSGSTADDVVSLGIAREKIAVVPPGFERFQVSDYEKRELPVRILSVGTLCPRKDQLSLVRSLADLRDLNFELHILGDESTDVLYSRKVRDEAQVGGIGERTFFHGHLCVEELHRMYNESHILANLSLWEGYGIAVAEALWAGLPVIAADAGAVPELVEDGVQGFLIPPGDTVFCSGRLRELIADDVTRKRMSDNARKRAEELYTWQDTEREFVKLAEMTGSP